MLKKSLFLTTVFILLSVQSANALFGSECRAPKSSYSNFQKQALNYQIQSAKAKIEIDARVKSELASCNADYKSYAYAKKLTNIITKKSLCGYIKFLDVNLYVPGVAEKNIAIQNSYQVVINNQKCFTPELVIEAQRALKLIK